MDALAIRPAETHDLEALHDLVESAYRGDRARKGWTHEAELLDGQRTDREVLERALSNERVRTLLGFDGDDLVGCVQVSKHARGDGKRCARLGMLAVAPELQAKGYGRQLIEAAETCAREAFDAQVMEMTVIKQRDELIAYYARRGYQPTGGLEPFPYGDERFGLPRTDELAFAVLAKAL